MENLKHILTEELYFHLNSIIDDAEGIFPVESCKNFFMSNLLTSKEIAYLFAKYLVYKGINISSHDQFFDFFDDNAKNPGLKFWIAYDALIRGKIENFKLLWEKYISIELKNYDHLFLKESLVIPEDPIFINVADIVHDHQHRLLNKFIVPEQDKERLSEKEFDEKLEIFLGEYSSLLAFFRIQHIQFKRDITLKDLQLLEEMLNEKILTNLGSYWEFGILSLISYWRLDLGLIYEASESITLLKVLNGEALNNLLESQIFHLEALISINNNNIQNFRELTNSALYLSSKFNFIYQQAEILLSKAKFDRATFFKSIEEVKSITNEKDHKFIRAKIYTLLSSYYISQKDWKKAEQELLKASKFLHNKFDLNSYYKIIADFSYVLITSNQLKQSLESSQVLLEDEVPILYKLRGFYLYGLANFLLLNREDALKFIEEGIRVALTYKEEVSLPWFYELLGLIYISINDWKTSLKYFELTFKAYFEISLTQEGYRARIITTYLLALDNNFGVAFTQIQNLLVEEISNTTILFEILWALQAILILSKEKVPINNYIEIWNQKIVPNLEKDQNPLLGLYFNKNNFFLKGTQDTQRETFNENLSFFKVNNLLDLEYETWKLLLFKNDFNSNDRLHLFVEELLVSFDIIKLEINLIGTFKNILLDSHTKLEERTLIHATNIIAILRILKFNLPFPDFL